MARESILTMLDFDAADSKRTLMSQIGTLKGMYEVEITPRRGTRSQKQNAWYWSCIVRAFWEYLRDQDWTIGAQDEAHEFLKARFLARMVIDKRTGEMIGRRVRSTTELTTDEMADYCERCRVFLSEFCNTIVPDPDPAYTAMSSKGVAAV